MALTFPPFAACDHVCKAANNSPWMKLGDRGDGVAIVQGALVDLGYKMPITVQMGGTPDGKYGKETYDAVHKFQSDFKLGVDGTAGKQTIGHLDVVMLGKMAVPPKPAPKLKPKPPISPVDGNHKLGASAIRITHDVGAGVYASKKPTASYRALKIAILGILPPSSIALVATGPNAVKHMQHYFRKSGTTYTIDLENMVTAVPAAKTRFRNEVAEAQAFVEKLPVGTHTISSKHAQSDYNTKGESRDWFFAIGGYSVWGQGSATVTDGPSGPEYTLEFDYKFEDKYNWDGGKEVTLAGITITDEFMAEFHRMGLAKEFICTGSIRRSFTWKAGEAIPEGQYSRKYSR